MNNNKISLFLSYSHHDTDAKNKLLKHISPLINNPSIICWDDNQLIAGQQRQEIIIQKLKEAKIILLLISANSLASDYIQNTELKIALENVEDGKGTIVPIIITPCLWQETILGKFQAIPRRLNSVSEWKNEDSAYHHIAQELLKLIYQIQGNKPKSAKSPDKLPSSKITRRKKNKSKKKTAPAKFTNNFSGTINTTHFNNITGEIKNSIYPNKKNKNG